MAKPGSSASNIALSSPHSPTTASYDTATAGDGDTVACYSEVTSFTNGKATVKTPAPSTPAPVYMYTEVKRSNGTGASTVPASCEVGRPDNDAAAALQYSQAIIGTVRMYIICKHVSHWSSAIDVSSPAHTTHLE